MERMEEWGNGVVCPLAHVKRESAGGVCMWARADSPATHHCPTITTPN